MTITPKDVKTIQARYSDKTLRHWIRSLGPWSHPGGYFLDGEELARFETAQLLEALEAQVPMAIHGLCKKLEPLAEIPGSFLQGLRDAMVTARFSSPLSVCRVLEVFLGHARPDQLSGIFHAPRVVRCDHCRGSGQSGTYRCAECGGTGRRAGE